MSSQDMNALDVTSNNTTALATGKPTFSLKNLNLAKACPGIVVASTGTKLSRYAFPKIKFEEGRRCRLAILTEDVIMCKVHYNEEMGYIICDGGACCKYCDKVSIKYCYPCVVYETNEAGKPVSSKVELKLLVLGGELYEQISLLSEINESITGIDLIFSCTSTQFQKCQVTQASNALWMNNPDVVKYVEEYMTNNSDKLMDAMGKTYTAEQFAEKLGDPNAPAAEQRCLSAAEISDVFNV